MEKRKSPVLGDKLISVLEEKIRSLESENEMLRNRETNLKAELTLAQDELRKMEEIKDSYRKSLDEISEIKESYFSLIREARLAQKEFEKKTSRLITSINNK